MGVPGGDISIDYQPTINDSERAFGGILDIVGGPFLISVIETDLKANATVTYQNNCAALQPGRCSGRKHTGS